MYSLKTTVFLTIETPDLFANEPDFIVYDYETAKTTQFFTTEEQEKLATDNMLLVHQLTHAWGDGRADKEDIFGVAEAGLVKAIHGFDPRKNYKFSTFAHKCITNEILFYLRKENRITQSTISMESVIASSSDGKEMTLEDVIGGVEDIATEFANSEILQTMMRYVEDYLTSEEQFIIKTRFGIGTEVLTQLDIARILHISQANVSKKEKGILKKLRVMMNAKLGDGTCNIF